MKRKQSRTNNYAEWAEQVAKRIYGLGFDEEQATDAAFNELVKAMERLGWKWRRIEREGVKAYVDLLKAMLTYRPPGYTSKPENNWQGRIPESGCQG